MGGGCWPGVARPGARRLMPRPGSRLLSASKWIYGAYVAEQRAGPSPKTTSATPERLRALSRVARAKRRLKNAAPACSTDEGRKTRTPSVAFDNGGHMQQHAVLMGLGRSTNQGLSPSHLARSGQSRAGAGPGLAASRNWPAGRKAMPATTAAFASDAVGRSQNRGCWVAIRFQYQPRSCPGEALKTPIPATESWHYSLGHWVEDDPPLGDGAFSSPGRLASSLDRCRAPVLRHRGP